MSDKTKLSGTLSTVRFHSPDSHFMVGVLETGDVVVGEVISPQIGCEYVFVGEWARNPRFGSQFKFSEFEVEMPTSKDAIKEYLVDNLVGCGPIMATRIVDAFGDKALEVLREKPEDAADIRGMRSTDDPPEGLPIKLARWSKSLNENAEHEKLVLGLKELFKNTRITRLSLIHI